MNQRAFNLFTALVAMVIIILAGMLWQSMRQAEDNTVQVLRSIEQESRVESILQLVRYDALQTINLSMRRRIEDWLYSNTFNPVQMQDWGDSQTIIMSFVNNYFGTGTVKVGGNTFEARSQFAAQLANEMQGIFLVNIFSFSTYSVRIIPQGDLETGITNVIQESTKECGPDNPAACQQFITPISDDTLNQPCAHLVQTSAPG